jgi:CubicO group peptidase (beta-lactamase class C family)
MRGYRSPRSRVDPATPATGDAHVVWLDGKAGQDCLNTGGARPAARCPRARRRSIRKPLLGALFGRYVADGRIDLDTTLADLGINDAVPPPLTAAERSARVRDLLTCRSGIYHPSSHQGAGARAALPPRGAHQPGTHFFYNNWDFNALGTILERCTGMPLFDEFADTIAGPAGMQDFDRMQQQYATEPWSEHRTYSFRISARDLARFGQWWIARSGRLFAGTTVPGGSFAAYGTGSQTHRPESRGEGLGVCRFQSHAGESVHEPGIGCGHPVVGRRG